MLFERSITSSSAIGSRSFGSGACDSISTGSTGASALLAHPGSPKRCAPPVTTSAPPRATQRASAARSSAAASPRPTSSSTTTSPAARRPSRDPSDRGRHHVDLHAALRERGADDGAGALGADDHVRRGDDVERDVDRAGQRVDHPAGSAAPRPARVARGRARDRAARRRSGPEAAWPATCSGAPSSAAITSAASTGAGAWLSTTASSGTGT